MVGAAPRLTSRQIKAIPRDLGVVVQACDPGTGKWSQIIRSRWDHAQVCVCRHGQHRCVYVCRHGQLH